MEIVADSGEIWWKFSVSVYIHWRTAPTHLARGFTSPPPPKKKLTKKGRKKVVKRTTFCIFLATLSLAKHSWCFFISVLLVFGGRRETGVSIAMEIRISGQGWVWALASHTLFSVEEEKRIANKFSPDSNHLPWNNPKRFAKKLGSHRIILYLRNVRNVFRFVGLDNRPWIIGYVLKIVSFRQSEGKYLCEAHTGKTSFQSVTLNA